MLITPHSCIIYIKCVCFFSVLYTALIELYRLTVASIASPKPFIKRYVVDIKLDINFA